MGGSSERFDYKRRFEYDAHLWASSDYWTLTMQISAEQGFNAMKTFLEMYWNNTGNGEEIRILLASLDNEFTLDGLPHDRGLWERWLELCSKLQREELR